MVMLLIHVWMQTWCWISDEWASMRIYTCYMVVWGCILTSLVIYTGIGMRLFRTRIRLRHMSEEGIHSREIPDRPLSRDNTIDRVSLLGPMNTCSPTFLTRIAICHFY